jgi:hypothetical protein
MTGKRLHPKIPLPICIAYEVFSKPRLGSQWKDRMTLGFYSTEKAAIEAHPMNKSVKHYCVMTRSGLYRLGSVYPIHLSDAPPGSEYSEPRPPLDTSVMAVLEGTQTQAQVLAITETYLAVKAAYEDQGDLLRDAFARLEALDRAHPLVNRIRRYMETNT